MMNPQGLTQATMPAPNAVPNRTERASSVAAFSALACTRVSR